MYFKLLVCCLSRLVGLIIVVCKFNIYSRINNNKDTKNKVWDKKYLTVEDITPSFKIFPGEIEILIVPLPTNRKT